MKEIEGKSSLTNRIIDALTSQKALEVLKLIAKDFRKPIRSAAEVKSIDTSFGVKIVQKLLDAQLILKGPGSKDYLLTRFYQTLPEKLRRLIENEETQEITEQQIREILQETIESIENE